MKKILLIIDHEFSAYQMSTYLKQNEKRYIVDLLTKNKNKNNLTKIFRTNLRKSFYFDDPPSPKFFSILKFWNIVYAKRNKLINKKVQNLLRNDSFEIKYYDEIYFSNEIISHYILYKSNAKKIFFAHSPIDVLLNVKFNLIKKIKIYVECFVNNTLMNIYFKGNGNFQLKSIFHNFLKKKKIDQLLSIDVFKKIFSKYNKYKIKKISKYNYNLINFATPYYVNNIKYPDTLLKNYVDFFLKNILNKIFKKNSKDDVFLIKFRKNIPKKFQLEVMKLIKKKFPMRNIILVNKNFPRLTNLDKVIINFNIKQYFTTFSSSIYISKILDKKILIYDYTLLTREFWKKNWINLKTKNNFNNYPLAIKFYKNLSKKL
jgi:hypothetical protein